MSAFTILLAGGLSVTDRLLRQTAGNRVVAADGGMRHAEVLHLRPELWVGDFDSTEPALMRQWGDVERQPFSRAKNATDGEIAVDAALERGARSFLIVGALGGERTDHAVMHLLMAMALAERGFPTVLSSGEEEACAALPGITDMDMPAGSLFSILPFSPLDGLTIEGARYPLMDADIASGSSRTISNIAEGPVRISLRSGRAMVVARPYDMTGA